MQIDEEPDDIYDVVPDELKDDIAHAGDIDDDDDDIYDIPPG